MMEEILLWIAYLADKDVYEVFVESVEWIGN